MGNSNKTEPPPWPNGVNLPPEFSQLQALLSNSTSLAMPVAWLIVSTGPGGGQVRTGVSPLPQPINEIKQFEAINGKTFRFVVELARAGLRCSSAGSMSQLPQNFRGEVRALLRTHISTRTPQFTQNDLLAAVHSNSGRM